MLQKDVSGIYNVGTGTATSFQSVAESVAKKYNAKIQTIPMPQQLKGQYQSYTCADLTELNKNVIIKYKTVEQYLND
jgi:ADP-L-glycero-D-manno-heptose 6-epimerase